jgi:hypothetical protein|tara:strand:- start:391 stop:1218 length:828 start_codon:yes stop_codon:yes gene_type:complete
MSGGGGGGGAPADTTNVQTIREAPEIEARRLGLIDDAAILAGDPLNLPDFQVAALTGAERDAVSRARTGTGAGLSSIAAAESAAALDPTSQQFQNFLNPYQSFITDEINRQAQLGQQQVANQAVRAGAFGGGREGVQRAEQERARLSEIGLAQGRAFQGALGAFQQGQQLQAQTGLAAGDARMRQQQGDIQNLLATGGLERGVEQAQLEAARQNELQRITDPYQRLSFVSDIQRGAPSTQSTVTQGFAPQGSPFAQALGTGIGAYAALAPNASRG